MKKSIMKKKIVYVCLGISFLLNILTVGYILRNKLLLDLYEQAHWYHIDRTGNVVPDEETAKRIAEAIIDADELWTWDFDEDYETEITFDEETYRWKVAYLPKLPEGMMLVDGDKCIWIRKDNGWVEIHR